MKNFQEVAPTIHSWLKFNRFRKMRRGWLRLLIVIYAIALAALFIAAANVTANLSDEFSTLGAAVIWFYWPIVRIWLWIYDGFQKDKKRDAINLDGNNRNN